MFISWYQTESYMFADCNFQVISNIHKLRLLFHTFIVYNFFKFSIALRIHFISKYVGFSLFFPFRITNMVP